MMQTNKMLWIYGRHAVSSAVRNPYRIIESLFITKITKVLMIDTIAYAKKRNIPVQILETEKINCLLYNKQIQHQGIVIRTVALQQIGLMDLDFQLVKTLIFLDQVTDSGNIGAIIRSALAFSASAVINVKNCAPEENATMVKAASGAFEHIPYICVTSLRHSIQHCKKQKFWIFALTRNAINGINIIKSYNKKVLLFGAENCGIRRINMKISDLKVSINMSNKIDSLNIATAASITLYSIM